MFEVKNHAHPQVCDPKIVQHQTTFVVRDSVDHFGVHDNGIESDQVGNEAANLVTFVEYAEQRLLPKGNFS